MHLISGAAWCAGSRRRSRRRSARGRLAGGSIFLMPQPDMRFDEAGLLSAFDTNRELIYAVRFQGLCAWPQRLLRSAQRRFLNNGGPPLVEPRGPGVNWTAERSM